MVRAMVLITSCSARTPPVESRQESSFPPEGWSLWIGDHSTYCT